MENEVLASIDHTIAYYMVDNKLTQTDMARLLGMSTNTLRWKREGKSGWSWSEILTLSRIVGKTPDEIAGLRPAFA